MAMQVVTCCNSASAALRVVGLPAESSSGSLTTILSSSSCSALSKSGRAFNVRRERWNWVGRTRVCTRGGGKRPVLVRAGRGGRKTGENESKTVYDAFFLGKALAETINERVGSAIGEFLSDVGRRQAEQRKKIREFQDEVQERAAAAAVKAAQKAKAIEKEKEKEKENTYTAPPPPSSSPAQPPLSTSGLSDPTDAPSYMAPSDIAPSDVSIDPELM